MGKKVFISHGHNELVKHKIKDFIRKRLKMEPIVLSEQKDLGLTIVEKLETYAKDCWFALILLTADDQTSSGSFRSRQNVIHELGYFHALLGRKKVLLLKETQVELFSNISGLIYKEFKGANIEAVFEDVRLAIESGNASQYGISVIPKDIGIKALFEQLQQVGKDPRDYFVLIQQIAESTDPSRVSILKGIARGQDNYSMVEKWEAEAALKAIAEGAPIPDIVTIAKDQIPQIEGDKGELSAAMSALKALNTAVYIYRKPRSTEALNAIASAGLGDEKKTK
jgi:hypothetical protein